MEKIEEIEWQQVPTFQGRQYLHNVWQCCLELLSLNVGVQNIEPVIRSVLHHIAQLETKRLPQPSILTQMLTDLRTLSYEQIAEELR